MGKRYRESGHDLVYLRSERTKGQLELVLRYYNMMLRCCVYIYVGAKDTKYTEYQEKRQSFSKEHLRGIRYNYK